MKVIWAKCASGKSFFFWGGGGNSYLYANLFPAYIRMSLLNVSSTLLDLKRWNKWLQLEMVVIVNFMYPCNLVKIKYIYEGEWQVKVNSWWLRFGTGHNFSPMCVWITSLVTLGQFRWEVWSEREVSVRMEGRQPWDRSIPQLCCDRNNEKT